jgi:hypothetical protein
LYLRKKKMSTPKLTDLYKQILSCVGMVTDDEGFISHKLSKELKPALIDGKRMVMPYYNQLSSGDNESKIVFHPLRENIMLGESPVVSKLRNMANIRLNQAFGAIAMVLLDIAASTDEHAKLNPFQSEMLSAIGPVTSKVSAEFKSMMMHGIANAPDRAFINIFLRRGGMIGGKKYPRVGAVTFPLMEELQKEQKTYYGAAVSKKNLLAFQNLARYIFPDLEVPEKYYCSSSSEVAPFLDCLMKSIYSAASKINDVLELFGPLIDGQEALAFSADWVETFTQDLDVLLPQIKEIPTQAGNEGSRKSNEPVTSQTPPLLQTQANPTMQQVLQNQQTQHQPAFNQSYQQPVYHQPPPPVQQGPIVTDRGVNFQSLLNTNPALQQFASTPNQFTPQPQPSIPLHLQEWARFGQQPVQQQYFNQQNNGFNSQFPSQGFNSGMVI